MIHQKTWPPAGVAISCELVRVILTLLLCFFQDLYSVLKRRKDYQTVRMWNVVLAALRPYVYYISVPVGIVVGTVGVYTIEQYRKETPYKERTIQEERDERKLRELEGHDAADVAQLKSKIDIPKTVLDRNDRSRLEKVNKTL